MSIRKSFQAKLEDLKLLDPLKSARDQLISGSLKETSQATYVRTYVRSSQ